VAHRKAVLGKQKLDFRRELEQPDHVGDGGAVLARAAADLFVAEFVLACEAVIGGGHFDGVQILALDIFDQGNFEEFLIGELLDYHRDLCQSGQAGCAPAAFAGDEFVAVGLSAHDDGLDDAVGPDGVGKFAEALLLEDGARLERVGVDQGNGKRRG
jgi:hypothetical protein